MFVGLAFAIGLWWLVGIRGNWLSDVIPALVTGAVWIGARSFVPRQCEIKVRWWPVADFVDLMADHLTFSVMNLGLILLCVGLLFKVPRGRDISIAVIVVAGILEVARRQFKFWKARKAERRRDLELSEGAAREWDLLKPSGSSVKSA